MLDQALSASVHLLYHNPAQTAYQIYCLLILILIAILISCFLHENSGDGSTSFVFSVIFSLIVGLAFSVLCVFLIPALVSPITGVISYMVSPSFELSPQYEKDRFALLKRCEKEACVLDAETAKKYQQYPSFLEISTIEFPSTSASSISLHEMLVQKTPFTLISAKENSYLGVVVSVARFSRIRQPHLGYIKTNDGKIYEIPMSFIAEMAIPATDIKGEAKPTYINRGVSRNFVESEK